MFGRISHFFFIGLGKSVYFKGPIIFLYAVTLGGNRKKADLLTQVGSSLVTEYLQLARRRNIPALHGRRQTPIPQERQSYHQYQITFSRPRRSSDALDRYCS